MKLVQPFTGVEVEATEDVAPRLIERGYTMPKQAAKPKAAKAEKKDKKETDKEQ